MESVLKWRAVAKESRAAARERFVACGLDVPDEFTVGFDPVDEARTQTIQYGLLALVCAKQSLRLAPPFART